MTKNGFFRLFTKPSNLDSDLNYISVLKRWEGKSVCRFGGSREEGQRQVSITYCIREKNRVTLNLNFGWPQPNRFESAKNSKSEYRNPKQIRNSKVQKSKQGKRRGFTSIMGADDTIKNILGPLQEGKGQ